MELSMKKELKNIKYRNYGDNGGGGGCSMQRSDKKCTSVREPKVEKPTWETYV
jgi:hypothetical protein